MQIRTWNFRNDKWSFVTKVKNVSLLLAITKFMLIKQQSFYLGIVVGVFSLWFQFLTGINLFVSGFTKAIVTETVMQPHLKPNPKLNPNPMPILMAMLMPMPYVMWAIYFIAYIFLYYFRTIYFITFLKGIHMFIYCVIPLLPEYLRFLIHIKRRMPIRKTFRQFRFAWCFRCDSRGIFVQQIIADRAREEERERERERERAYISFEFVYAWNEN